MKLREKISNLIFERTEEGKDPQYLLLDRQTYFTLKELHYKSTELAIEFELEEYEGLRVFVSGSESVYIDVA